jgi:hypothetical protein
MPLRAPPKHENTPRRREETVAGRDREGMSKDSPFEGEIFRIADARPKTRLLDSRFWPKCSRFRKST